MDFIEIKAELRQNTGKGPARSLRRSGKAPAILYGPDTDPVMLTVTSLDLENALKKSAGGHGLFKIAVQNGEATVRSAMLKEMQRHPLSGELLHVDFYEVAMDRKIKVMAPVTTTGKSGGVELGGILQIIRRELEIICLPHAIPESIPVDISNLELGGSIHVADIEPEGDIEIPYDVNFTVLTMVSARIEEEEETEEEEEEAVEAEEAEPAESE
ncbi:MAG: 50S ribosomal protein L25 [Desulfobacterales bacterium]|nr:50S ribosomal protein L25 [Desulfobacterales bacterium]